MPGILSGTHADVIMVKIINIAMNLLNGEANMRELMSPKNLAWPIVFKNQAKHRIQFLYRTIFIMNARSKAKTTLPQKTGLPSKS